MNNTSSPLKRTNSSPRIKPIGERATDTIHATPSLHSSKMSNLLSPSPHLHLDARNFDSGSFFSRPLPKANAHRRKLSSFGAESSRNSSLNKVWAEDYYDSDNYVDGGSFEKVDGEEAITPPPAAALSSRPFPRSVPISADEESCAPRQTRTQRSLTALLPFRVPKSRGNSKSPERKKTIERETVDDEFMPTLTGDRSGVIKLEDRSKGGLASWFSGSSAPVAVGIPISEKEAPSSPTNMSASPSRDASPERQSAKLRKRPTLSTMEPTPSKTPASTSRFNFFSSPKSPPKTQTIQLPTTLLENDEFLTLDIISALNTPGTNDPFSPAAFKNLLMNAEGLLLKLQTAYKLRTLSLHELSLEKSAQIEELEEAETRAQCLRNQLEDMSHKMTEQDRVVEDLVRQLANEKQARAEEKEAREKSIALLKTSREALEQTQTSKRASCCSNQGEEDLGISLANSPSKKWRRSNGSTDLSGEGESDTESESVFSRSRSPTIAGSSAASTMTTESTPEVLQASFGRVVTLQTQAQGLRVERPKLVQQTSTFQKILNGMSPTSAPATEGDLRGMGLENGCKNCQGKNASVAWDAVGLMRAENKGLKERVGVLEGVVEEALDLCNGLRL